MAGKMPLRDEIAKDRLLQQRRMVRADRFGSRKHIHHLRWHHQITQPQGREKHRRETAREYNYTRAVKTLQRGNWPPRIAVFAVVIVFEDQRSRTTRPLEQRQAASQSHGHAQGKLMGRSDVYKAGSLPPADSELKVQSFRIHRYAANTCAQRA